MGRCMGSGGRDEPGGARGSLSARHAHIVRRAWIALVHHLNFALLLFDADRNVD